MKSKNEDEDCCSRRWKAHGIGARRWCAIANNGVNDYQ